MELVSWCKCLFSQGRTLPASLEGTVENFSFATLRLLCLSKVARTIVPTKLWRAGEVGPFWTYF